MAGVKATKAKKMDAAAEAKNTRTRKGRHKGTKSISRTDAPKKATQHKANRNVDRSSRKT